MVFIVVVSSAYLFAEGDSAAKGALEGGAVESEVFDDSDGIGSWFRLDAIALALLGVAIAVVLSGIGSAVGIGITANMGIGAMHESPDLFPQVIILSALPGTQGIYGFVVGFLIILWSGILGGDMSALTLQKGWYFFCAGIPVGIAGLISAIHQGKVCASGVGLTAKDKSHVAKGMVLGAFVEFYAILGLLASVLILLNIK
ncbi:V-type ATP synthase subunit K [bacterium]|nr:V-type ATP synthase subunit K [bacterium]